jgi:hypothetical protein
VNKKYKSKVIQYSLNGEILNIFNDATHASKSISNYDSIINCCIGKYKTSGGYIFRFESDPLITPPISPPPNPSSHVCKICHSHETVRSMAMHLRFAHNLKTEKYVEQYGEFRPKQLKAINKQSKSNFNCQICNMPLNSNQHLMYHITTKHPEISQSDYIIKYIYNGIPPLCKCGCGESTTLLRNGKNCDLGKETYNRDYIKGHWDWDVFSNVSHQSKEEIEVLNYIKSIYTGKILENYRIETNLEIDIYLPELNIGIEYNGLYWHCEENGRGQKYHINKTIKSKNQGIRLIQIFSDEWLNKQEIVKSKLKSILNIPSPKVYARQCNVREIDKKIKNKFLNLHHIQGEDRCKVSLGLFHNQILIGVMTFSLPRVALGGNSNQIDVWELSRYSTSKQIVGGASKLIKYFYTKYHPKKIYSYSDNRWTDWDSNMYLSIGFKFVSISSPGYWYTKNFLERKHRYNFTKNKIIKIGMGKSHQTEKEIMHQNKYSRIWDCGSAKYECIF